ncbi:hypothetical protein [Flavobacterium sp.]|uniref:hypothetical protein n=1 Tax=Flavobacterium sp. TaxID=239 RepID=UPI003342D68C
MKYFLGLLLVFGMLSCDGNKEVQLPKADKTIVADVQEHSPIYIFFKVEGKDTIAKVNRKNSISSTNWIFNIDKRLPLHLVVPELIKLQAKKDGSMHKNEASKNYFSYANEVKKTMAFMPFTMVKFLMKKPKTGAVVYFAKNNKILVDDVAVQKDSLENYLDKLPLAKYHDINFCFDKNSTFDSYIKNQMIIRSMEIEFAKPENFIF